MENILLPLSRLLRLALDNTPQWLNHAPEPNVEVAWVVDSPRLATTGDLLLLPAELATPDCLQQIVDKGLCAVLLLGPLPADAALPAGAPPTGVIQDRLTIRLMMQKLLAAIVDQRAALTERGARIYAQLSQLAAESQSLEQIASAMASLSGKGVIIHNKRLNILGQQPASNLGNIWDELVDRLSNPSALPVLFHDRHKAGKSGNAVTQQLSGGLERLIAPVTVGGVARGHVSLVGIQGTFDDLDHLVLEQGVLVCALEMARAKSVREAEKRLKGDLLLALLQGGLTPRDAALWAQSMGLDTSQAHTAIRFAWDAPSPPSRRRLETLVNGEVARLDFTVLTSPMGTEVICFCQTPPVAGKPGIPIQLAQAVLEQGTQEYPQIPLRCGVGSPAHDISEWRISFRQAGQALELSRRLGESKPLYYPELSVYRLLFQLEHSPELNAFLEEVLGPLLAHENANELTQTLEAFFEHRGNLAQTAEALFIHRNTLVYRLERIAAISDLDLDSPETRLAVQLALYIHHMLVR